MRVPDDALSVRVSVRLNHASQVSVLFEPARRVSWEPDEIPSNVWVQIDHELSLNGSTEVVMAVLADLLRLVREASSGNTRREIAGQCGGGQLTAASAVKEV